MAGVAMVDVLLGPMVIVWVVVVISGTVIVTVLLEMGITRSVAATITPATTIATASLVYVRTGWLVMDV